MLKIFAAAVGLLSYFMPTFSSSTFMMGTVNGDGHSLSPLALLGASVGRDSRVGFDASYDLVGKQFMGWSVAYRGSSAFNMTLGTQRYIYYYENSFSPRVLEAIGYSMSTSYLGGYSRDLSGINSRARDFGLSVSGKLLPRRDYHILEYAAGVFNGNGYSARDNNKAKDLAGRVALAYDRNLKFSVGAMSGKYNIYGEDGVTVERLAPRIRYSAGVWYDNRKTFLRAENIYGNTDGLLSNGTMALLGTWVSPVTALSARAQYFRSDVSDAATGVSKYEAAWTRLISGSDLSLRLQLSHTRYANGAPSLTALQYCLILRFSTR